MQAQSAILTVLRNALPSLSATVSAHQDKSRRALGRIVCAQFNFVNARGDARLSGCMKALGLLESEGHFSLPKPQTAAFVHGPRLLAEPVPKAVDVPTEVGQIKDLEVILVTNSEDRAIWNTLLDSEHPQGSTTFAGAQLRYLIRSAHGELGVVGFSSAALYLRARDEWMAWDHSKRAENLNYVVNLSRFLIRPDVFCKNLASHALGRVLRRLPSDFEARYGYAPYVIETFVGPEQEGTCFRAVGFQYLGLTQGRGRHAPSKARTRSQKKVFAYELEQDWRTNLEVPHVELRPQLAVGAGLDSDTWALQEFGDAELGDRRRSARLVKNAELAAKTMGNPVTTTPERDPSAVQAYWNFWDKADKFGITPEDILAPHRQRTIERMRTQETVLCVQDGTKISYSTRPRTEGLEVIGQNQTSAKARGVCLHATIALNDEGLPLGVLRCAYGKAQPKTQSWLYGLLDIDEAAATLPRKTNVICVMDREADAFEILSMQRTLKRTHLLVRAKHDRKLGKAEGRLFKAMRKGPSAGVMELSVEQLSRRMKSGRVTHKGRPGRNARMEMRYRKVTLPPTRDRTQAPMAVWGIHLRELNPPANATPIEWYLLTTQPITTREQAQQMVEHYRLRWRVEDTFRVLKSGCKVEKLRMQKADSQHRVITMYMVTAWRIMLMTMLGRTDTDLNMDVFFRASELKMMKVYARSYGLTVPTDLASAILTVAMMGGYMNRKHDPPPGHTIMWRGYANLQMRAVAYEELGGFYDLVERPPP